MKKSLIALAVAASFVGIAQAENTTTLYGALSAETAFSDSKNSDEDNKWDLSYGSSKFGIKGTEDLSNGLQAIYKMEFDFDAENGVNETRYGYVGLKGDFGTLTLGKTDSLYGDLTTYNDIFENGFFGDENANYSAIRKGSRIAKQIRYDSPDMSGLHFGIAGILDGGHDVIKTSDSKSFVGFQTGVWYEQNGLYASLAYSSLDGDLPNYLPAVAAVEEAKKEGKKVTEVDPTKYQNGTTEVIGANIGYENDQFRVGLGAEHAASLGEKYNLAGAYYLGPNTFRAGFAVSDSDDYNAGETAYTYALGYQYNFSKRTFTYIDGTYIDHGDNEKADDGYTVNLGLRHDF